MSFSNLAATTNGPSITITYSYTGSATAQIQAYVVSGEYEFPLGVPVTKSSSIVISSNEYDEYFQQGAAYGILLKDDSTPPIQSLTNYYIYCKANDSSNVYLGSSHTNAPFIVVDIGTRIKSAVLPPWSLCIGKIFYVKVKNTSPLLCVYPFSLVPSVKGLSYPLESDQLILTNSTFDAFESTINGNSKREVFTIQNSCYSYAAIADNDWSILSSYDGSLAISTTRSSTFANALSINLQDQIHIHNYADINKNLLNLNTLSGNCLHYIIIYRSAKGPANSLYMGFGENVLVDESAPPANQTKYVKILLSQWDIFCLTIHVNSENNKIYIVHTSTNTGISTGLYEDTGIEIKNSLVQVTRGMNLKIPMSVMNDVYGSIRIIKYPSNQPYHFSMSAKAAGELTLFSPGSGFVDNITSSVGTSLCIWLYVGYDSITNNSKVFILHQHNY